MNGDQKPGKEYRKRIIDRLAPGFRFMPTDTELFEFFLLKRLKKEPLPANNIIEVDIYKYPPDQFKGRFEPNGANNYEWYFFSPRSPIQGEGDKTKRGKTSRGVKLRGEGEEVGYWNATGGGKLNNGEPLPKSLEITKLKYISGSRSNPVSTNWHMTEYRIKPEHEKLRGMSKLEDLVLCKIYKKLDKFEKDSEDEVDITNRFVKPELKFSNNHSNGHHHEQEFRRPSALQIGSWGSLPPIATLSASVMGAGMVNGPGQLQTFENQEDAGLQCMNYFKGLFGGPKDGVQ